jgi:D-alanyl-D-alanine carboxypeptidase
VDATGRASRIAESLSTFIADLMPHWPVVGGAVAVVDRDGTIAQFGFGHADREHRLAATSDHLFQIGSISKTFVSVVVNQLVDEGIVDLDEPITEIVPWVNLGQGTGPVTVRQLLSHTGGLVLGGDGVPDDVAQLWALRDLVRSAEPQQHFHYSNVGFMLLGQAVQATGYWPMRDDIPWAPGDPLVASTWFEIDAADGNVASSAADMARFTRFLLGFGEVDGVRVMSNDALLRMAAPTAPGGEDVLSLSAGPDVTSSRYGLGVNVETIDEHTCLTHGGGMVGFQSFLLADQTAGIGIVVLTNANGCYPVAQVIARAGHHLVLQGPDATLPAAHSPIDLGMRVDGVDDAWLGDFVAPGVGGLSMSISRGGNGALAVESDGAAGTLVRTWTGRLVSTHPALREFRWDADRDDFGVRWTYGSQVFRPVDAPLPGEAPGPDPAEQSLIGRYRSYSPWFPTFSVLWRDGRLFLVAPGGVEAPDEDCELVRVPGGWRIGADEWLPERLKAGPVLDGRAVLVVRDGVPYSRVNA